MINILWKCTETSRWIQMTTLDSKQYISWQFSAPVVLSTINLGTSRSIFIFFLKAENRLCSKFEEHELSLNWAWHFGLILPGHWHYSLNSAIDQSNQAVKSVVKYWYIYWLLSWIIDWLHALYSSFRCTSLCCPFLLTNSEQYPFIYLIAVM